MPIPKKVANILIDKPVNSLRRCYYLLKRCRLKNHTPTLLCNDCFGGIALHNLGLQFRTPTINLFLSKYDFMTFVTDLPAFLEAELTEISDDSVPYPVGCLEAAGKKIRINFMHYDTFDNAKKKWDERKKRVSLDNIYILQSIWKFTAEDIEAFDRLPYKNKMLVVGKNLTNSKNVVEAPIFLKPDYRGGEFLEYPSRFAIRRNMDKIDYVGFLNRPRENSNG